MTGLYGHLHLSLFVFCSLAVHADTLLSIYTFLLILTKNNCEVQTLQRLDKETQNSILMCGHSRIAQVLCWTRSEIKQVERIRGRILDSVNFRANGKTYARIGPEIFGSA